MNVVIAMDSFKGSLSSVEATRAAELGVMDAMRGGDVNLARGVDNDVVCVVDNDELRGAAINVRCYPLADGGEGSSAILAGIYGATGASEASKTTDAAGDTETAKMTGTAEASDAANPVEIPVSDAPEPGLRTEVRAIQSKVKGPMGAPVDAVYYILGDTAFIDIASASGITLVDDTDKNIMEATTYGTGQLVMDAINKGAQNIVLCLGGSATNDYGMGMLEAMGAVYKDAHGNNVTGRITNINKITDCDLSRIEAIKANVSFTAICDVDNPLAGERGAAKVFGPQKGASESDVEYLDQAGLKFASVITPGINPDTPGYGAAGGVGYCVSAVLGGRIIRGADYIIETTGLGKCLEDGKTDVLITGEGAADMSSLGGKAAYTVCKAASEYGVPRVFVIAGRADVDSELFHAERIVMLPDTEDKLDPRVAAVNVRNAAREIIEGL